jgi:hypothetical protein
VLEQIEQEHARLGRRPADDPARVDADEEELPARSRVGVDERPDRGLDLCTAESPSTSRRVRSSSVSHAARRSANSVLPPQLGVITACSIEYAARGFMNELSLCHSWLAKFDRFFADARCATAPL